ncbi:hypothetical protein RclHR1_09550005 [Rhizophagus clarus]|uniref:Uncharacterized protein n=1 Tax=Rhizophagus clarus TaxID=94130 RepID=A0A2Z6S4T0_9GLOM|nr:hypothetical protein RclHR1_09550005 [Rhizophagus clarus]
MKRSAFLKRLRKGPFVYQEDLGRLCSICSTYGYDVFKELTNLIIQNIENQELQTHLLRNIETLKQFLKRDYPKYLHVTFDGKVSYDSCINHYLLFAFGKCDEEYMSECVECNEIFNLFKELQSLLGDE